MICVFGLTIADPTLHLAPPFLYITHVIRDNNYVVLLVSHSLMVSLQHGVTVQLHLVEAPATLQCVSGTALHRPHVPGLHAGVAGLQSQQVLPGQLHFTLSDGAGAQERDSH